MGRAKQSAATPLPLPNPRSPAPAATALLAHPLQICPASHLYMKFCTARFSRSLRCFLLLFLMSAVIWRNTSCMKT